MNTVYKFKPWARLSGDPQKIGEEIERIKEQAGGSVSPDLIVQEARADASPLHPYFEWEDSAAADKYREVQASHLLRSIVVVESPGINVEAPVRAFVSVRDTEAEEIESGGGSYVSIADAVRIVKYREQMMRDALRDLDAYRVKYQLLSDLGGWHNAIQKARGALVHAVETSHREAA